MGKAEAVTVSTDFGARNLHKVPQSQWRKWAPLERRLFNELFGAMKDQALFRHPKAVKIPASQWKTSRWNAAWTAAEFVRECRKAAPAK